MASLEAQVLERFKARGLTLGFAESCTGGGLASCLTKLPGVSAIFRGSIVCYDNGIKEKILGVPSYILRTHGAVSWPVAREMARGARQILEVDWCCSVTGIAGPSGGSPAKPVGTVCFAVCGPGFETVGERHFSGDRESIQHQSVEHALGLLLRFV